MLRVSDGKQMVEHVYIYAHDIVSLWLTEQGSWDLLYFKLTNCYSIASYQRRMASECQVLLLAHLNDSPIIKT